MENCENINKTKNEHGCKTSNPKSCSRGAWGTPSLLLEEPLIERTKCVPSDETLWAPETLGLLAALISLRKSF
jgi:hypothetical protein